MIPASPSRDECALEHQRDAESDCRHAGEIERVHTAETDDGEDDRHGAADRLGDPTEGVNAPWPLCGGFNLSVLICSHVGIPPTLKKPHLPSGIPKP
jgi:hypothetical protein